MTDTDTPEWERVAAVHELSLLDTPPEQRFDSITRMARKVFGVPVAEVNLLDEYRQFTKSPQRSGTVLSSPRSESFCDVTIRSSAILVVPDASVDARFADRATVTGERHIRFYAGRPLTIGGGHRVGTLCLVDTSPRELSAKEYALLEEMGRWAERELEGRVERNRMREVHQGGEPRHWEGRSGFRMTGIRIPGQELGGSFYDWVDTGGPVTVSLGEVIGPPDGAFLLAAALRSGIRARIGDGPSVALRGIRDQIGSDLTGSTSSATVFHGRLDPLRGCIDYVDAGHGLTLLARATGAVELLAPTGLPLGVADRTAWAERTVSLGVGDVLLVGSTGLVDILGSPGATIDALATLAVPGTDAAAIIDRIGSIVGGRAVADDVTAIAISRTG